MIIFNKQGEARNIQDSQAATRLIKLKDKHGDNVWPVVEECLKIFEAKRPAEYKSYLVELKETKDTRRNKFASSSETEMFRYTLDIPEMVIYMLRKLYTTDELPMDKKFMRDWARRFPKMRVSEKI